MDNAQILNVKARDAIRLLHIRDRTKATYDNYFDQVKYRLDNVFGNWAGVKFNTTDDSHKEITTMSLVPKDTIAATIARIMLEKCESEYCY
jgi:hypothetical protein